MFLITNKNIKINKEPNYQSIDKRIQYFADNIYENTQIPIRWIIIGSIFPKKNSYIPQERQTIELLLLLFEKYKEDYYKFIKGDFILIEINPKGFRIFSDHFAIRKFFIWKQNKKFIISDELHEISKLANLNISKENIALYSLNYHFTGGKTLFTEISHNQPGEYLEYIDSQLENKKYWNARELLEKREDKNINIKEISSELISVIKSTITINGPVSLSLTGGADTRNLLSIFLSLNNTPHLYTYGNPQSNDCMKASAIAKGLNLNHSIHDINMTEESFEEYARKIIKLSSGLASIHRAHRLMAVEKEKDFAEFMYLGTLGGEFVKGVSEDDYIVPSVVYDNWSNHQLSKEDIKNYLRKKRIKDNPNIIDPLMNLIIQEPFMKGEITERKLNALTYITAHLHDAQDVNLYRSVMKEVFTPFLNIDYLELLFSSSFSFNNKETIKNKYLKRIENPVYACRFLEETYPQLLKFKYSGEHKPSEILLNKYLAAVIKLIRKKTSRSYPPNFPLSTWMERFVQQHLPICNDYQVLTETFDLDQLQKDLKEGNHIPKESYWLKFTNPIMMRFIIEEFNNG